MAQGNLYQYQRPVIPENWSGNSRRFAVQLLDTLDIIYAWRGRLGIRDLSNKCLEDLIKVVDDRVVIDAAQIKDLETSILNAFNVYIKNAKIDTAQIANLTAEVLSITKQLDSLKVNALNASTARIETLYVKGRDIRTVINSAIDSALYYELEKIFGAMLTAEVITQEQYDAIMAALYPEQEVE